MVRLLPRVTKIVQPLLLGVLLATCESSEFAVVKTDTELTQQEWLLQTTELAGLPPLPQRRAAIYDYYKLGFLHDKYPGKYVSGTLVPHPIYGVYVINDYLNSFKETGNTSNLHAAITVADAAISRMVLENEMLLFFTSQTGTLPLRLWVNTISLLRSTFSTGSTHRRASIYRGSRAGFA